MPASPRRSRVIGRAPRGAKPRFGLILGAGGTVGLAYHAGVLRALSRHLGLEPDRADLIVGTSAGSVIAAYTRSGWSTGQMWDLVVASGDLPPMSEGDLEVVAGLPDLFQAAFSTPIELARRSLGSAYVVSRSMFRAPLPVLPAVVRRTFPGGLFVNVEGKRRFSEELPEEWPERATWLCAVDIVSGRRIVLGRNRPPRSLTLQQAVLASCAIPGAYPPVRYGRRELIDGGAHSSSNLDLAAKDGCDLVVGVIPMAYDSADRPCLALQATRRLAMRSLEGETQYARRLGSQVLLIRPSAAEVRAHGTNLMRRTGLIGVARAAYESAARMIESDRFAALRALASS